MLSRTPYKSVTTKKLILILEKKKISNNAYVWVAWSWIWSQVEVPDGKSRRPDPDERTTGVSCVQIFLVWKQEKRTKVWT